MWNLDRGNGYIQVNLEKTKEIMWKSVLEDEAGMDLAKVGIDWDIVVSIKYVMCAVVQWGVRTTLFIGNEDMLYTRDQQLRIIAVDLLWYCGITLWC